MNRQARLKQVLEMIILKIPVTYRSLLRPTLQGLVAQLDDDMIAEFCLYANGLIGYVNDGGILPMMEE